MYFSNNQKLLSIKPEAQWAYRYIISPELLVSYFSEDFRYFSHDLSIGPKDHQGMANLDHRGMFDRILLGDH